MPLMERKVEVIRGWPNDGALDNYETIKSGETLNNGDIVIPTATGVSRLSATGFGAAAGDGCNGGIVFSGNGDSSSSANSGKAVVIWGSAIINADESMFVTLTGLVEGDRLTYKSTTPTTGEALKFKEAVDGATPSVSDEIVGVVLKIGAPGTGLTASTKAVTVRIF